MANVSSGVHCPKSMIYYVNPDETNTHIQCDPNNCCLKCPLFNNFYGEGKLEQLFAVLGSIGIIGFFMMVFLVVSFIVLPSAKNNPITKKILLPFALSVALYSAADFFSVEQKKSQCASEVEQATIHNNNLCAAQAFFELSGAYAVAIWASILIVNLHLLSVWRSDFLTRNIKYFHIPIWLIVFLAAVIPMRLNEVDSGGFCFISKKGSPAFFYCLSFIFPVSILHLVTLAYMAKVSSRANRGQKRARISFAETQVLFLHIRHIIRVQWRAFMGAAFMLIVYVTDMLYFMLNTRNVITKNVEWLPEWTACFIETDGDQNQCAKYAKVSPFAIQVIVLSLNRCVGVVIFIIFAAKRSVFQEWSRLLRGRRGDDMTRQSSFEDNRRRIIAIRRGNKSKDAEKGETEEIHLPKPDNRENKRRNMDNKTEERSKSKRTRQKRVNGSNRRVNGKTTRAATSKSASRSTTSKSASRSTAGTASSAPLTIHKPKAPVSAPPPSPMLSLPPPPAFEPPTSLSPRPRRVNSDRNVNRVSFSSPIVISASRDDPSTEDQDTITRSAGQEVHQEIQREVDLEIQEEVRTSLSIIRE